MSREIFEAKMAELKASQDKSGTMFSNEEYQHYIDIILSIHQQIFYQDLILILKELI